MRIDGTAGLCHGAAVGRDRQETTESRQPRSFAGRPLFCRRAFGPAFVVLLALMPVTGAAFEPEPGTFEPGTSIYRPPRSERAPDPAEIVRACKDYFIDCFRVWQPPEPTEPEPEASPRAPDPPPSTDRAIPPAAPAGAHPADVATYEALVKAIGDLGLKDKLVVGPPPSGDSVDVTVDPAKKSKAKPTVIPAGGKGPAATAVPEKAAKARKAR